MAYLSSSTALNRSKFVKGPVVDAITNRTAFIGALKKMGKIMTKQGGLTIRPPAIRYKDHVVQNWDGRSQLSVYEPDLYTYAEHSYVGYVNTYINSVFDNLTNQGEEALAKKDKEDAKALLTCWNNLFDSILFANGGLSTPVALNGLEAFMKNTGTYGGVSQSAQDANGFYYWGPTVINGGSALSPRTYKTDCKAYLKNFVNTIANRTKSNSLTNEPGPDFAITTQTVWEATCSYYEEKVRLPMTVSTDEVGMNTRKIRVEGMDLYWTNNCPSGNLYGLTMDELEMFIQTSDWFDDREVPVLDPICTAYQSYWKGQLVTNNPRAHGKITSISV